MSYAQPSDNLYFAELPVGFDEGSLMKVFGAYGKITQSKILSSNPSGKVAALVRFASASEAAWIVDNLNGNIPQGLSEPIIVRYADAPKSGKGEGGYGKAAGKGDKGGYRSAPYQPAQPYAAAAYTGAPAYGAGAKGGYGKAPSPYAQKGAERSYAAPPSASKGAPKGAGPAKGKGKGSLTAKAIYRSFCEKEVLPGCSGFVSEENSLYVSGLPIDTTDLDLYRIFAPFGALAARAVRTMCHQDGNCKGFGFVNYLDASSAQAAAEALNGVQLPDGTALAVRPKTPKEGQAEGAAE